MRQCIVAACLLMPWASAAALNNCLPADFVDRRGRDDVIVANDQPGNPLLYRPRCVTISAGSAILFRALPSFGNHPLFAGSVSGGVATFDPTSPIGSITSGAEQSVLFVQPGEFPYYCDFHYSQGMMGSVRVVSEWFADGFE